MIVAADKTVMLMIEHKHIFLDLIDIMDEGKRPPKSPCVTQAGIHRCGSS